MKRRYTLLIAVLILVVIAPTTSFRIYIENEKDASAHPSSQYSIMRPTSESLHEWLECYNGAPRAPISPKIEPPTESISLLSHLKYVPAERDQGSCGNCWVWAGTGILEIALDVNEGISDRLSVQYFNSKYNGGTGPNWAGCGGWLEDFAEFYANEGFAIPWSNTNAAWADGSQTCADGTSVPWETISTEPNYPITKCAVESIQTFRVGQTAAISNIKSILAQGRAIWFGFFLPTTADWNQFFSFWNYQPENSVWNPDYSCGHVWDSGGGGHAVLCVGYNDTDPNNAYWIMVNSWGVTSGRPNGIFYLDMDMNYDCYFYDPPWAYYSFYWQTLDVTYNIETVAYTVNLESLEDTGATTNLGSITFNGTSHSLPSNVSKEAGNYSAEYFASDGYVFDHWETTGEISVSNATANPVNVTVSGDGTLKVVYRKAAEGTLTLASIEARLLNASQNNAYFLFADPTRMQAVAAYDVASGGIIYGLCQNPQIQGFDCYSDYVEQTEAERGKLLINNKTVLFFGGPRAHWCVSYHESAGLTPVKFYCNESAYTVNFVRQSGETLASLPTTTDFNHEDMFLIEVFRDGSNNTIYVFYGFSWKGTWAAGIYFHGVLRGQLDALTDSYYIYHWVDLSGDGMPQPSEIHQEYPQ